MRRAAEQGAQVAAAIAAGALVGVLVKLADELARRAGAALQRDLDTYAALRALPLVDELAETQRQLQTANAAADQLQELAAHNERVGRDACDQAAVYHAHMIRALDTAHRLDERCTALSDRNARLGTQLAAAQLAPTVDEPVSSD